jgi:hypothetical protein
VQQHALAARLIAARRQPPGRTRIQSIPRLVKQQRILRRLARKHPFRQARDEDDAEGAASRLRWAADEQTSVAARRRLAVHIPQPLAKHEQDFGDRDRTHRRHRTQIRQYSKHIRRCAQRPGREVVETIEPVAPVGQPRPRRHLGDERQRERPEVIETLEIVFDGADTR